MPLPMAGMGATVLDHMRKGLLCPCCRSRRVLVILAGVVLMSLGDLYMTLQYLLHFGLLESNPMARAIIQHGSPWILAAWKLCTLILAVGILAFARRRLSAELGTLFCCGVMAWLTVRWIHYSDQVSSTTRDAQALLHTDESRWVTLAPGI